MQYKGFKYQPETEYEPELIRTYHFVITPEGEQVHFDWSSFSSPTEEEFKLWIDLGLPDRDHPALQFEGKFVFAPLDNKDLNKIKESYAS